MEHGKNQVKAVENLKEKPKLMHGWKKKKKKKKKKENELN